MSGKLITIEGTDCSGKETQSKMLLERLKLEGRSVCSISFPVYDSPTGKVVGGSLLGKPSISDSWFENPASVDPKIASLYYAADRRYHLNLINEGLKENEFVILDRYTYSNMAHQGGKYNSKEERLELYNWIERLEFDLLELPRPDFTSFLYMPYEYACILKKNRNELDMVETDEEYLRNSEKTYLELAELYGFGKVDCVKNNNIRTIEEIHEDVYKLVKK